MHTHPGVLGLLQFQHPLCSGKIVHPLESLDLSQEGPLRRVVRAGLGGQALLRRGRVRGGPGAGRVAGFEGDGGGLGLAAVGVLAAGVGAAGGTAGVGVVTSVVVVLHPYPIRLVPGRHLYLQAHGTTFSSGATPKGQSYILLSPPTTPALAELHNVTPRGPNFTLAQPVTVHY